MEIIVHRVNTVNQLMATERQYGAEIDIRVRGSDLILAHDPFEEGEYLIDYLDSYQHGTLILNIKESGIEDEVLSLVRERPAISSYFLLDVEIPYLYRASMQGEKAIAVRFSEIESIDMVEKLVDRVTWVWIDTITSLPIVKSHVELLSKFKTCLVCPERWNKPDNITVFQSQMREIEFWPDAVMTSIDCLDNWYQQIL